MLRRIAAEEVTRVDGDSRAALDLFWPGPDASFLGHVLKKPDRKDISPLGDMLVAKDPMLRVGAIVVLQVRGL
ncbi:MAG TPA: hypothetical protein VN648_30715, partial [Candidatus Methylomirabilis sp.]|nr:hypothetical protein [Candidatus Methylomirabilis sp.]